jgi:hypothetical protein
VVVASARAAARRAPWVGAVKEEERLAVLQQANARTPTDLPLKDAWQQTTY